MGQSIMASVTAHGILVLNILHKRQGYIAQKAGVRPLRREHSEHVHNSHRRRRRAGKTWSRRTGSPSRCPWKHHWCWLQHTSAVRGRSAEWRKVVSGGGLAFWFSVLVYIVLGQLRRWLRGMVQAGWPRSTPGQHRWPDFHSGNLTILSPWKRLGNLSFESAVISDKIATVKSAPMMYISICSRNGLWLTWYIYVAGMGNDLPGTTEWR